MITQERVRELFEYREDGNLVWRIPRKGIVVGTTAGNLSNNGYLRVTVDGRSYLLHRLIWLYHYGYLPEAEVDHIDQCKLRNRRENLREVSRTCNLRNTGNPCTNTSGVKGVGWHKKLNVWRARIVVALKDYHLGQFSDFTEAVAHRLAAEQALNWEGCNSCSPAFKHMQDYLRHKLNQGGQGW